MKPLLLCTLLAIAQASNGQDTAKQHLYVVKAVGEWVVDAGDVRLKPLMRVPVNARVTLRPGATADTSYTLVLRDPRTLRVAELNCRPVGRCRGTRQVSQLTFAATSMPTTPRLGELFVQVGGGEETRARVKMVGARGDTQDWGMLVLTADSGWLNAEPITSRLGADRRGVVLRFCALDQATAPNEDCESHAARRGDCDISASTRCGVVSGDNVRAVALRVFVRNAAGAADPAIASAIALLTSTARRPSVVDLTSKYLSDLERVRPHLTEDEFYALSLAAAQAIARQRP